MDAASTVFSYDSVSQGRCDAEKLAQAEQIIDLVDAGLMSVDDISPGMEHCIGQVLLRRRRASGQTVEATAPPPSTVPDAYPEADESSTGGDIQAFEPEPEPAMDTIDEGWEYGVPGPDMMLSDIDDAYEGEDDEIVHWDDTLGRWVLLDKENYTVIGEMNEAGEPIYYGDF